MEIDSFKKDLRNYAILHSMLIEAQERYDKAISKVNAFDCGKDTPLTLAPINEIRQKNAKECREAKYALKDINSKFSKLETKLYKQYEGLRNIALFD